MDEAEKLASGSMYPEKDSSITISLPDLPVGASFGTVGFEGVSDVIGKLDDGDLTLTADKYLGPDINGFTTRIAVNGGTNYNDYVITVSVAITHHTVALSVPVLSAGEVSVTVYTRLQEETEILFFVVCYDAQGRMLGLSLAKKSVVGSTTEIVLDYPSHITESDVAQWQVVAVDTVGFFLLGQAATVDRRLVENRGM